MFNIIDYFTHSQTRTRISKRNPLFNFSLFIILLQTSAIIHYRWEIENLNRSKGPESKSNHKKNHNHDDVYNSTVHWKNHTTRIITATVGSSSGKDRGRTRVERRSKTGGIRPETLSPFSVSRSNPILQGNGAHDDH